MWILKFNSFSKSFQPAEYWWAHPSSVKRLRQKRPKVIHAKMWCLLLCIKVYLCSGFYTCIHVGALIRQQWKLPGPALTPPHATVTPSRAAVTSSRAAVTPSRATVTPSSAVVTLSSATVMSSSRDFPVLRSRRHTLLRVSSVRPNAAISRVFCCASRRLATPLLLKPDPSLKPCQFNSDR